MDAVTSCGGLDGCRKGSMQEDGVGRLGTVGGNRRGEQSLLGHNGR